MSKWLNRCALRFPPLRLCVTEKDYLRVCKKLGIKEPLRWIGSTHGASTHFFTSAKTGMTSCVVTINKKHQTDDAKIVSRLAHEATHVMQEMLEGIHEKAPGNEVQAYAVEAITYQLVRSYRRQMK